MSDAASAIENIVIYQMKLYVFLKQETIALDAAVNEPEPYEVCSFNTQKQEHVLII